MRRKWTASWGKEPPVSEHPRTEACYDRAEATVNKFRHEGLRLGAQVDELDAECRALEAENAGLREAMQKAIADITNGIHSDQIGDDYVSAISCDLSKALRGKGGEG